MSNIVQKQISNPRAYLNLESASYRLDKVMMSRCQPSAPLICRAQNGTNIGIDLWKDWNGRLFYVRTIDDRGTVVTYLKQ